jgi:N-acyl-D-aspartate/D-glutamate deacylase
MFEYDLIVLNGLVVTDQEAGEFDIAVKDGKVAKIAPRGGLKGEGAKKTIDAEGGMVMVRSLLERGLEGWRSVILMNVLAWGC